MKKRVLAFIFAAIMILSLVSCGKSVDQPVKGLDGAPLSGIVFCDKDSDPVALGSPSKVLDPQEIYRNLTYTPQMFYGDYLLQGGDEARLNFAKEHSKFKWTKDGEEVESCVLPVRVEAGESNLAHVVAGIEGYEWMRVCLPYLYEENEYSTYELYCAYEVSGNKLTLKPLDHFKYEEEQKKINYTFSDIVLEYTFAFEGRNLTLSSGNESVTLTTGIKYSGENGIYLGSDCYLSPESKSAQNIDCFDFRYDSEDESSYLYCKMVDGQESWTSVAKYEENGLFTITLALEESCETYQYVCFLCGEDGLVLTDGTNTYYYNDSYSERYQFGLVDYISEEQAAQLANMSESQLEAVVEKKENLMADLAQAFNEAGIKVTVDEKTGELAMDSTVLFGGDSAVLTDEGKAFLNKFVAAYTSIVFSEKYDGFVNKTMVEGHTAPVAGITYEASLPLSEKRANNVKDYCVSPEVGVDITKLAENLEAIGYSNSKPVKDANGNVDMAASRRVSFRFIINLEQN